MALRGDLPPVSHRTAAAMRSTPAAQRLACAPASPHFLTVQGRAVWSHPTVLVTENHQELVSQVCLWLALHLSSSWHPHATAFESWSCSTSSVLGKVRVAVVSPHQGTGTVTVMGVYMNGTRPATAQQAGWLAWGTVQCLKASTHRQL
ncbi:hypothetical protein CCHR01_06937 [Colletotrichum chrysophilum]|uniref:Uncharacterized protein n=1 Tax=Colletotrichum chrysophilum TaxID=1836956 RepID=A0AAD9ARL2_9PEZI|nr:hypothetical protein CCHR01_06937 [Colletotrichum chrysophilum]